MREGEGKGERGEIRSVRECDVYSPSPTSLGDVDPRKNLGLRQFDQIVPGVAPGGGVPVGA